MAADSLIPKRLAAAIALGGLSYMMVESAPHWGSIGIGLCSLAAFVILWLWPTGEAPPNDLGRLLPDPTTAFRDRPSERLLSGTETPPLLLPAPTTSSNVLRERRRRTG